MVEGSPDRIAMSEDIFIPTVPGQGSEAVLNHEIQWLKNEVNRQEIVIKELREQLEDKPNCEACHMKQE
jgi:hypothetical protein